MAEAWRSTLVKNALDLIKSLEPCSHLKTNDNVDWAWERWIKQEKIRRVAWGVYEEDCYATLLHNEKPHVQLTRLRVHLPCSGSLWNAESATDWALLTVEPSNSLRGPFFPELLEQVTSSHEPSLVKKITDIRHQQILKLTLMRMQCVLEDIQASVPQKLIDQGIDFFKVGREHIAMVTSFLQQVNDE